MVNTSPRITAHDVEQALGFIRPYLVATPSRPMMAGARRVVLKLETEQPTGSFKVRGALSNLGRQPETPSGFVTASAGNHGLGVAWAARALKREEPITIFVPTTAPDTKLGKLKQYAIDLRVGGQTFDDAEKAAWSFEAEMGARFIHAYDDPLTSAGQGTVAMEIGAETPSIGTIIVPVGGGGLMSGCAAWLKERRPEVRIVAVQAAASPSLSESIRLGEALLDYPAEPTLADGLSGGIGRIVFNHRDLIDQVVNVPEANLQAAIRRLHEAQGLRAEASGAITLAALDLPESEGWPEPIVCVITGGNLDDATFAGLIA